MKIKIYTDIPEAFDFTIAKIVKKDKKGGHIDNVNSNANILHFSLTQLTKGSNSILSG